eukprot:TRINITY_DN16826_c0_g1_i4.p1 TRINITY_DN16826_c0_g1~~TRINITY_DN16826_c0_g1_i4.p1  ORF type:complete len:376 (-),score=94.85 TRINITY_DN16826_c0_g1_i4:346-1419(-)
MASLVEFKTVDMVPKDAAINVIVKNTFLDIADSKPDGSCKRCSSVPRTWKPAAQLGICHRQLNSPRDSISTIPSTRDLSDGASSEGDFEDSTSQISASSPGLPTSVAFQPTQLNASAAEFWMPVSPYIESAPQAVQINPAMMQMMIPQNCYSMVPVMNKLNTEADTDRAEYNKKLRRRYASNLELLTEEELERAHNLVKRDPRKQAARNSCSVKNARLNSQHVNKVQVNTDSSEAPGGGGFSKLRDLIKLILLPGKSKQLRKLPEIMELLSKAKDDQADAGDADSTEPCFQSLQSKGKTTGGARNRPSKGLRDDCKDLISAVDASDYDDALKDAIFTHLASSSKYMGGLLLDRLMAQ